MHTRAHEAEAFIEADCAVVALADVERELCERFRRLAEIDHRLHCDGADAKPPVRPFDRKCDCSDVPCAGSSARTDVKHADQRIVNESEPHRDLGIGAGCRKIRLLALDRQPRDAVFVAEQEIRLNALALTFPPYDIATDAKKLRDNDITTFFDCAASQLRAVVTVPEGSKEALVLGSAEVTIDGKPAASREGSVARFPLTEGARTMNLIAPQQDGKIYEVIFR